MNSLALVMVIEIMSEKWNCLENDEESNCDMSAKLLREIAEPLPIYYFQILPGCVLSL